MKWGLGRLVRKLAESDGLEQIRYTTSHPNDIDEELIAAHRDVPKVMPFLHLPVQSGSDRVLRQMNRKHDAVYRALSTSCVTRARTLLCLQISSSDIQESIGFADTLRLVSDVG